MRAFLITFAVCLLVATASASYFEDNTASMFADFKATFGRQYSSVAEEQKRFAIFKDNMRRNAELNGKNPLAHFGVNAFADMSAEEFLSHHNGEEYYRRRKSERSHPATPFSDAELERILSGGSSIDWREEGAVTAVKNQGSCGSCWAFSTTGNIEGQWFLANNTLTSLSEQELVACDTNDEGCDGGLMDNAFEWLINNQDGEIATEASYPYASSSGTSPSCANTGRTIGAQIVGYKDITKTEAQMLAWLKLYGPIAIAVDANTWQTYSSGIITTCESTSIDHGVLLVGYGVSGSTKYWIIKNSWGSSWGESGYIRVEYGEDLCLITDYPTSSNASSSSLPTSSPSSSSPTSAPSGTFEQIVCSDSSCSSSCESESFDQGTCYQTTGGGSMIATCSSSYLSEVYYPYSTSCSGTSQTQTVPLNECLQSTSGDYVEFECNSKVVASGALKAKKGVALRHLRKAIRAPKH